MVLITRAGQEACGFVRGACILEEGSAGREHIWDELVGVSGHNVSLRARTKASSVRA